MRVLISAAFVAAFFMGGALADEPGWRAGAYACPAAMPGKCVALADRRDPQPTEGACKERAREMLRSALPHLWPVLRAGTRCERVEPEGQGV